MATWTVALPSGMPGPPFDLGTILRDEMRATTLVPEWTCPCCGGQRGAKSLLGRTAPDCLVVQLLRFAWSDGALRKLSYPVRLPVEGLNIETVGGGGPKDDALFSLRAFATHSGGPHGRHYEAPVFKAGEWWATNDSGVSERRTRLSQNAESEVSALFLQRVPGDCGGRGPGPLPVQRPARC